MKNLLKMEELAQLLGCIILLVVYHAPWWAYPLLVLGPDISMLGYLAGPRAGAASYNLFHHKGFALAIAAIGLLPGAFQAAWTIAGLVVYGHSCMDRCLGYGLKLNDAFRHTHLGWIGHAEDHGRGQRG